jgi:hypothetical protein
MKIEHAAWTLSDEPNVKRRYHVELKTMVFVLGALQLVADVFQVLGLSI